MVSNLEIVCLSRTNKLKTANHAIDKVALFEVLMQADNETVQDYFRGWMSYAFLEAMEEEVARLCAA